MCRSSIHKHQREISQLAVSIANCELRKLAQKQNKWFLLVTFIIIITHRLHLLYSIFDQ